MNKECNCTTCSCNKQQDTASINKKQAKAIKSLNEMNYNPEESIKEKMFKAYLKVQELGTYNMFDPRAIDLAQELGGVEIEKSDWADMMTNYSKYKAEFGDDISEDLDLGHQDNEPHMLKADLYRISKYAIELYKMMDQFDGKGEVDFPHWWQSKIIKAKEMMVAAKHYLDFEVKKPQIDALSNSLEENNEERQFELNTPKKVLSAIRHEYGPTPTMDSVADFVLTNDLDDDMIADLIGHFRYDPDDFLDALEKAE